MFVVYFVSVVERIYFHMVYIELHSSLQLKNSSWVSCYNSKSKSLNCCYRSCSSETFCVSVFSVLDILFSVCSWSKSELL